MVESELIGGLGHVANKRMRNKGKTTTKEFEFPYGRFCMEKMLIIKKISGESEKWTLMFFSLFLYVISFSLFGYRRE